MLIAAAFYKFVELRDFAKLKDPLLAHCDERNVKGTVLLAAEGINGTIAGTRENVNAVLAYLRKDPRLADLTHKESPASEMPFYRMKVRLKREIVALGVPGVSPIKMAGKYVKPDEWNKLLDDPNVVFVDVRNDYEVAIGTFKGALNPKTKSFGELPQWIRQQRELRDKPKVAMFCTGGIRCEKSTAFLRAEGFPEVFHLEGGILKYLEVMPKDQNRWEGECFVFDERVAVGHGLQPGHYELCRACRAPVGDAERASPHFERGVSCPECFAAKTDTKKAGLRERQRQVEIAKSRNRMHVGERHPTKKKLAE
jgi:UPF0176 protein